MFDLILTHQFFAAGAGDPDERAVPQWAQTLVLLGILVASILAIVTAVKRRAVSATYSADLLLSCFAPLMYWVLFALGAVSSPTPA